MSAFAALISLVVLIGAAWAVVAAEGETPAVEAAATTRPGGDWPQFRGPNRDNRLPDTGLLKRWPPTGPPLLRKTTGLGSSFSSVSVADGRIYTQCLST